jgi:hypothetical protein
MQQWWDNGVVKEREMEATKFPIRVSNLLNLTTP